MVLLQAPARQPRRGVVVLVCAVAALLAMRAAANGQPAKLDVLRVGSSGSLTGANRTDKEKAALQTLQAFIKDETGFNNEIHRQKSWQELADKMAKGELQLGVFQGYELAWAQEKHPELKPLALAINVYRYPIAYVVVKRDNPAKDFAGLAGQSLAVPATGQAVLRLFVERQCQANGKALEAFFSKITTPENVEDALDDVVDGAVKAVVADRAALEAYKRRKPGRFSQVKEVAHSQPLPPPVVAAYNGKLDEATLQRFREGLLNASRKERGQTMLTLFKLSGFEAVPPDFGQVLAGARKAYPQAAAPPK